MFDHSEILNKIDYIKIFFESIGLKKIRDFPKDWNLDSSIRFEPEYSQFIVNFDNENRVLHHVDIFMASGIHFVLSGKLGTSVYETIKTDYDLVTINSNKLFFKEEFRDWKINNILLYENN